MAMPVARRSGNDGDDDDDGDDDGDDEGEREMETLKTQESRVRRLAQREGYRVHKSRRGEGPNNHGAFMMIENDRNICALGWDFGATLTEIENWLCGEPEQA